MPYITHPFGTEGPAFHGLSLKECFHVLDHALRWRHPHPFDETVVRPLLLKKLVALPEHRDVRQSLKEWPLEWVHHLLYRLMHQALHQEEAVAIEKQPSWVVHLSYEVEWHRLKRIKPAFLETYWLNTALNYTESMARHPGGVLSIHDLTDVLQAHEWAGLLDAPIPEAVLALATPTHQPLWEHHLRYTGLPPWGPLLLFGCTHRELLQAQGILNPQHRELPYWLDWMDRCCTRHTAAKSPEHGTVFPLQANNHPPPIYLILVEGLTEEMILPHLLEHIHLHASNHHPPKKDVEQPHTPDYRIISCGGKTAMLKRFEEFRQWFNGSILGVLDADAPDVEQALRLRLHRQDAVYRIPQGSMEDCYGLPLFLAALNHLRPGYPALTPFDYQTWCRQHGGGHSLSRLERYQRFWAHHGLGQLDKPLLARAITEVLPHHQKGLPQGMTALLTFFTNHFFRMTPQ
jgi:hypothetical protein